MDFAFPQTRLALTRPVVSIDTTRDKELQARHDRTVNFFWFSQRNAVSFSSACTTKCFPSPRCASAIHIVRPLRSTAYTQPQVHSALLRSSAISLHTLPNISRTFLDNFVVLD